MEKIIHETGTVLSLDERRALNKRAASQQEKVYDYFCKHQGEYSAEHIWTNVMPTSPITSARRCLTNLMNEGKLEKSDKTPGRFGIRIIKYKLKKNL